MATLAVQLLGPLELEVDGRARPVPRGRLRVLLAVLAVQAERLVDHRTLIDALWEDATQPAAPDAALYVLINRFRHLLPPDSLETRPRAYRLRVAAEGVDALAFRQHVSRARSPTQWQSPAARLAALDDALTLWRGTPFSGVPACRLLELEASRLEEQRLDVIEERAEALLQLDRVAEAAESLAGLEEEHPLRERLVALRMLALYRSGRLGAAYSAYLGARRRLVDALGVEPSPWLSELYTVLLDHRIDEVHIPTLDLTSDPPRRSDR
jgi:DNA-binding SARP family transcriptional activator